MCWHGCIFLSIYSVCCLTIKENLPPRDRDRERRDRSRSRDRERKDKDRSRKDRDRVSKNCHAKNLMSKYCNFVLTLILGP